MNMHAPQPLISPQVWDGKPITQDGAWLDIPMEDYHAPLCGDVPDISSSGLRMIARNPQLYWAHSYHNPNGRPKPQTDAMIMGRAAHHLLLGEGGFEEHFIVRPTHLGENSHGKPWAWNGNRGDCREWIAEAEAAGLTVITSDAMKKIKGMAAALDAHPIAADFLRGRIEMTLIHFVDVDVDGQTVRVALKARPDAIPVHDSVISDLKCPSGVGGADPQRVASSMTDMGYPMQLGLGGIVWKALAGQSIESSVLVNAEQEYPHLTSVVEIHADTVWQGARECWAAVKTFARCWVTGDWPGYPDDGGAVSYPKWKLDRLAAMEAAGELPMLPGDVL